MAVILHSTEFALELEFLDQDIDYEKDMLYIGDVAISERTCVERKGASRNQKGQIVHDFVASIKDGRLSKQCQDLRNNYENPIMIIEGVSNLFRDESIDRKAITSAMASVTTKFNVKLIPVETIEDTARVIVKLAEFDGKIGYSNPVNIHPKARTTSEQQVYLITGMLDVGFKKAVELLTIFGNPMEIFKEVKASHYVKPSRGRKKKLISSITELKGFGPIFIEKNKKLLTYSFDLSEVNVNIS